MKKLLSVLLALAMLLGCAAMAETVTVDYVGTWVLTGMDVEGMVMGPTMLALSGVSMTLELNADGTCALVANGEAETGTWAVTETGISITDEVETLPVAYADGVLTLDQGGKLLFTREGAAPAVDETNANAVRAAVPAEEFEGSWLLTAANAFGMDFSAEDMGVYVAFVLQGGQGIYGENAEDGSVAQYPITYTVTEVEGVGTVLDLLYQDETMTEPVVLLSLNMLEDGRLLCNLAAEGMEISYYFTEQTAEAAAE